MRRPHAGFTRAPQRAGIAVVADDHAYACAKALIGARVDDRLQQRTFVRGEHADAVALDRAITQTLEQANVDLVVLVGYMKRLGPVTLGRFEHRMINTHPSLLPKYGGSGFFGRRVHEAVLANGDTESGATVHWVSGDYDSGPIIAQVRVPVAAAETPETLEHKVKAVERQLLIETLRSLVDQPVRSSVAS